MMEPDQNQSRRLSLQDRNRRASLHASGRPLLPHLLTDSFGPAQTDQSCCPSLYPSQPQPPCLPSYVKPLPPGLASEDVEYLERKGALSTPATELRNELLRSYIEYVHSYLPLLQLHDFTKAIEGKGPHGQISILLYQAVLFSGTAFVEETYLRNAGYPSRKVARKAFYEKAKVLYICGYIPLTLLRDSSASLRFQCRK